MPGTHQTVSAQEANSAVGDNQRLDDPLTAVQVWNVVEPWVDVPMILGEGPYYESATHSVRWIDIFDRKIYWVDLEKGPSSLRSVDVKDSVGVTADIHGDDRNIIVAAKYGFAIMHKESGDLKYLTRTYTDEDEVKAERMRFNDGAVDARGRFWAGSMTDNQKYSVENEGALFRLEKASMGGVDSFVSSFVTSPFMIPNGIGWSPAKKGVLYHTDSSTRTIWEFDYDEDKGTLTNKRPWFVLEGSIAIPATSSAEEAQLFTFDSSMVPDGFQFDIHGNLWSAIWGAGMVLRIEDRGQQRVVTGVVKVPARRSSCCRFVVGGGMIITSASDEEPKKWGDGGIHAGKTFWADVGFEGSETWKFKM